MQFHESYISFYKLFLKYPNMQSLLRLVTEMKTLAVYLNAYGEIHC